jgi:putative SOS response-associated peptidase YedK
MCGRYRQRATADEIIKHFELVDYGTYFDSYKESDEVFPGTPILAINNRHEPEYIHWTIRDKTWNGKMTTVINAKAENVLKSQMFREAFKRDRVLIPATALFEWQEQPDNTKHRFLIWFAEPLFAFAGIARDCEIKSETTRSGVIITTTPNDVFKKIHNVRQRQAVVIRHQDYERWLNPKTSADELKALMQPLPNEQTYFERLD